MTSLGEKKSVAGFLLGAEVGKQLWVYRPWVGNKKDELGVVNPPVASRRSADYNPSFVARLQMIHFSSC